MNDDISLLNAVLKNTEMGTSTLDQIMDVTDNQAFRSSLAIQKQGFARLDAEARAALARMGATPEKQSALAKMGTAVAIAGKTITDRSTRHLADMLIQGSGMGTVDCVKALRDNPRASAEAQGIAQRLQQFEERNVEELKSFL